MLKKLTYPLLFAASLFMLSISTPTLAIGKIEDMGASSLPIPQKININQASNKQLAAIKGIGSKKAQAIIEYRESNGNFSHIEELIKVKGIGKGTLKKIAPFVSL